jgi:hypothetical protein
MKPKVTRTANPRRRQDRLSWETLRRASLRRMGLLSALVAPAEEPLDRSERRRASRDLDLSGVDAPSNLRSASLQGLLELEMTTEKAWEEAGRAPLSRRGQRPCPPPSLRQEGPRRREARAVVAGDQQS